MKCDMCGKEDAKFEVEIEGTRMSVGDTCSKYGKVLRTLGPKTVIAPKNSQRLTPVKDQIIQLIDSNYANIIKTAREKKGLKQEEVAKKISEKESVIHNIESGRREPRLDLARKLEKFFGIILVKEHHEEKYSKTASKDLGMTVGDMISVKVRKK